uniref:Putative secreted protein n=1 Tax=Anopheles darlingi TaxID=43151 RepID=A0A2M4DIC1_ANODA
MTFFLLASCLSGLVVQSRKLPDTDSSPASDTDDRRLPILIGVPPSAGVLCDSRLRFRLLKLTGSESRRSTAGVCAMLSK